MVFLQLPHEAGVGLGDGAPLFHVVVGPVQVPAVLLHGVGDDRGRRAAHSHLAVHQALRTIFPGAGERQKGITKQKTQALRSLRAQQLLSLSTIKHVFNTCSLLDAI